MKKRIFKSIIIILLFNSFYSHLFSLENKIIVRIDNETVTTLDLKNKIRTTLVLSNQEVTQDNINKIKNLSLSFLINLRVKELELIKYNIIVDENKIINHLNKISSNDIKTLKNTFKINNLSFDSFKNELKTELMWQQLIYNLYSDKVNIKDDEVEANINNSILEKSKKKQYKLSEIEILKDEGLDVNTLSKDLNNFIIESSFSEAAKKFSISPTSNDGGNLGWINSTSLSEEILKMLNKMNIGDVSKPIVKFNTISYYKLNDIRELVSTYKNLEEARTDLFNRKKNELFQLYSNNHLSKKKNNSFIKIK
ncbi:peptidylprolyl isomerase [Pelagibacteraceae bacterium]|nr:peptidylprolyl isomerase [Pelagibacteraceae bacterium]